MYCFSILNLSLHPAVISWQHVIIHNDSDLVVTLSNKNTLLLDVFSGDLIRQIKTIKWLKFRAPPPTKERKWFATRDKFVKESASRIRIQYSYLSCENREYLQINIHKTSAYHQI